MKKWKKKRAGAMSNLKEMEKKLTEVDRALIFAYRAHKGQVRKYTNEPYICHPIAVASILQELDYDDCYIAAALLHDVVEDTSFTNDEIRTEFGDTIANLVMEVTDVSKPEDGNRATRKELDRQHIIKSSPRGKDIKLADLIDNTKSIATHDKGFAKIYLAEKKLLLDAMEDANPVLLKKAKEMWCIATERMKKEDKDSRGRDE